MLKMNKIFSYSIFLKAFRIILATDDEIYL